MIVNCEGIDKATVLVSIYNEAIIYESYKSMYDMTKKEAEHLLETSHDKEFIELYGRKLYVSFIDYPLINSDYYDHYNGGEGKMQFIIEKILKEQVYNS